MRRGNGSSRMLELSTGDQWRHLWSRCQQVSVGVSRCQQRQRIFLRYASCRFCSPYDAVPVYVQHKCIFIWILVSEAAAYLFCLDATRRCVAHTHVAVVCAFRGWFVMRTRGWRLAKIISDIYVYLYVYHISIDVCACTYNCISICICLYMYTCVDTQDICIIAHALLLSLPFFVCSSLSMRAYGHTYTHQIHVYSFTCTHICMLYISTCLYCRCVVYPHLHRWLLTSRI